MATPSTEEPDAKRSGGLLQMLASEQLGDLHGIERGALAEIVADDPQAEPVLDRRIFTDPADEGRIVADAFDRRHVAARLALIDEHHARGFAQDILRFFGRDLPLKLD